MPCSVSFKMCIRDRGKHPWKAEVSEDDTGVLPATISGWYEEVYEPDYSTLETA